MRRGSLFRSTHFRLALAFGTLFVATFLISGAIVHQLVRAELSRRLDQRVDDTWSAIAASYNEGEREDLLEMVAAYSKISDPGDRLILLLGPDGRRLGGNTDSGVINAKLAGKRSFHIKTSSGNRYRVVDGPVGANRLFVGYSFHETEDLEALALRSFLYTLAAVLAMTLAGGWFLASRAQARLKRIVDTMNDVSSGKLQSRILPSNAGDDLEMVSRQINQALERLAGLVEGMRQVSVDIAHDLKTPLNRMRVALQEAVETKDEPARLEASLREAVEEGRRIDETFDALLRIAQLEAGARRQRFVPVDLRRVLATIDELYGDAAREDGKTIEVRTAGHGAAFIDGDRELLIQLFANLTENAIRHCPAGALIRISLSSAATRFTVEVADNGPGIAPAEREKVFRRLYRLERSRTTPGNGLGLSLARAIAELHGGRIELGDNAPGLLVVTSFPALSAVVGRAGYASREEASLSGTAGRAAGDA